METSDCQTIGKKGVLKMDEFVNSSVPHEEIYQMLFENTKDIMLFHDVNGYISYISPSVEFITGYKADELLGFKWKKIIHHKDGLSFDGADLQNFLSVLVSSSGAKYRFLKKDSDQWISLEVVKSRVVYNNDQDISGVMILFRDVTEIEKYQDTLIKAKERAEISDRLKGAFLTNISHEVRTPLNAIMGFSHILCFDGEDPIKRKEYLDIVINAGKTLVKMMDDIITLSNIQSGNIVVSQNPVDVDCFLKEILSSYKDNEKNLSLRIALDPAITQLALLDNLKLKQIFTNLVSNSIKFTETGYIEIGCKLLNSGLCFWVKDTGMGIPLEKHDVIFDRFTYINDDTHIKYGGVGLGLSVCKELVSLLDGTIWFESEPGCGTTFWFTLPHEIYDIVDTSTSENVSLKNKKILIVEDNPMNLKLLEHIVRSTKATIFKAENASQALSLFKKESFDLILLDIMLPDKSGYEIVEEIRKENSHIPIIAQTAYADLYHKETCLKKGFTDYLTKPISHDDLLKVIFTYV
ncbi:TPA: hypothetical protein DEP21_02220 [Patescibacteria group bacterium]|nr:hypothetical protein [Candidatus Gracilibacteria bacterium]